jgi:hypothetical protein
MAMTAGAAIAGWPAVFEDGNIAPLATASASSSHPDYPLSGVNDNRMDTQWSTAPGLTAGQWLQLDWKETQEICGVVLIATGPWTQAIDVQVNRDGSWVSVGRCGSAREKAPLRAMVSFKPVRAKSVRFVFDGPAAYYEVEVFNDKELFDRSVAAYARTQIWVAGDLRGRLMGVVSRENGSVAIPDASVTVTGATPNSPWKESSRTGQNGEFEVALPFAATGIIEVAVDKHDLHVRDQFDCRDISTQLTPQPEGRQKSRLSLDGTWDFATDPPKEFPLDQSGLKWSPIQVPAHWEMQGFVAESGRAVYRKTFHVPAGWRGRRCKLRADAVYSHARLWVNRQPAGSHEGGFTPFELDITEQVKPGSDNEILALVDARSVSSDIDNASFFAYFELAGIWQPIEVFAVSPVHLSHLALSTEFDAAWQNSQLSVEADVVNEQGKAAATELKFRLFDPQGKELPVPELKTKCPLGPWSRQTVRLRTLVAAPLKWNAEQPRLYKLVAQMAGAGSDKGLVEQPFGFRQIEIKDRVLMLNGKPLKIRGISRLDADPLLGRALTPQLDRRDMEMIKEANFNGVRATIAPPHPASLDAADQLGLYFENEGPTCWGNYAGDLRYAAVYRGIMSEYVERDRNHPCVFDWSICNESDYGRVFSMAHEKMKTLDPTRIYSATWGDNTLDVDTYHHPITLQRIQESLNASKPVFFDEVITPFHGWRDLALFLDVDPGMRDYWIEGLPAILRALNAGQNQVGSIQFSWVDDAFLVPGKGIGNWRREQSAIHYTQPIYKLPQRGLVGDVVWGTVDGWRRPRPEYWLSKKLYSPVQIAETPLALPQAGSPIVIRAANWNQFADLNQYLCRWELGGQRGEFRPQVAPMSEGDLRISPRHPPQPDDKLVLRFYDERGRMVDAYRLSFHPHPLPIFPNSGRPARLVEQFGYLDNDSSVRLLGKNTELAYDRTSGELFRALADREVVMTLGPKLHLLKSKAPMAVYPTGPATESGVAYGPEDVAGDSMWHFLSADYRTESTQAVLNWKGKYGKDLEGGFEIRMDDTGDAEFGYQFTYLGPDLWVREIGLEFELPLDFDQLRWDRNAEYSYYPADHIGRPIGQALAHPATPQTVPPGHRPYGLDDYPLGCNDFRSVKRHIYTASLTNKKGQGVEIISDGTQHVRATIGTHAIKLKVLDYYGGSAWTYHGGFHYGPGRLIKSGETLKGKVRLKFLFARQI